MQSFSQFGEDILLWQYFREKPTGFFVEIGANHPTKYSQTWFFEQRGWRGLLVEPLAAKCELLRAQRPNSRVFPFALGAPEQRGKAQFVVAENDDMLSGLKLNDEVVAERTEEVEVRTLDEVLAEAGNPKLDLLSIDVEGGELDVLRGFDFARHRPAILLIEDHLKKMQVHRHILRHGYRLVKRTGCNNWYVPRDAEFKLTTVGERFSLRKEIWLDTPVRCVRHFLKQRRGARKPSPATT